MRKLLYAFIKFALFMSYLQGRLIMSTDRFALCDTTQRERALYTPVFDSCQSLGMSLEYYGCDALMDEKNLHKKFIAYKGIFFVFGVEFLKALQTSPVVKKVLDFVREYSQQKNKLIGFIFPPAFGGVPGNIVTKLPKIFSGLYSKGQHASFNDFSVLASRFLQLPCEVRELAYHTTLNGPRGGQSFYNEAVNKILNDPNARLVRALPNKDSDRFSATAKKTFPYGIYWNNPVQNNHVFISSTTLFTFSGISESFRFTPAHFSLREELLQALFATFAELKALIYREREIQTAPQSLGLCGKPLAIEQNSQMKKIAWMELVMFQQKEYPPDMSKKDISKDQLDRTRRQDVLVDYIMKSGLDSLWISMTPNIYYSVIAREPQHKKRFIDAVSLFTKKLHKAAQRLERPLPKILVGFEIADNVYPPNLPKSCARDVYNNEYLDIPCATDMTFWNQEIIQPLSMFVNEWKQPTVNNGLQLAGIVLDLEMYGRKTTGNFTQTMGFDEITLRQFLKSRKLSGSAHDVHTCANLLMHHGLTQQYYSFLEKEAYKTGARLARTVRNLIPDALIACYTPIILVDWFYKGLYKGVSDNKHPLNLCTFNFEFNAHKQWFDYNKIPVHHLCVLLLSKIKKDKDFGWVDTILKHHHGIWFNRFSRMVEEYQPESWIHIEQTSLDDKGKERFMQHIARGS